MMTNEKLKLASEKAEIDMLNAIPPDEALDWSPSPDLEAKIHSVIENKTNRFFNKRVAFTAAVAAVLLVAGTLVCVPLLLNNPPAESSVSEKSVVNIEDEFISPLAPRYIPEGYSLNRYTNLSDSAFEMEYTNGQDTILFSCYPAEGVNLLTFDEIKDSVYINGSIGYTANNKKGYLNNCVWNSNGYSFVVSNTSNVSMEELVRIASSVCVEEEKEEIQ